MKKTVLGLVMVSMIFSTVSFAQTALPAQSAVADKVARPAPPAGMREWMALMKKQAEARKALNKQLKEERDTFLKDHPEIAAIMEEQIKKAKEFALKRRAQKQASQSSVSEAPVQK